MKRFTGIYTPILTPFLSDDTLDEPGLRSNVAKWMAT
jgi:dihydrodipicolinate synthase/N-acetylneuraminate lyase